MHRKRIGLEDRKPHWDLSDFTSPPVPVPQWPQACLRPCVDALNCIINTLLHLFHWAVVFNLQPFPKRKYIFKREELESQKHYLHFRLCAKIPPYERERLSLNVCVLPVCMSVRHVGCLWELPWMSYRVVSISVGVGNWTCVHCSATSPAPLSKTPWILTS